MALKNNRDRIYGDPEIGNPVLSAAQTRAVQRGERAGVAPEIGVDDVAKAMTGAGLEFRDEEYVCTIAVWAKPTAKESDTWGD